MTPKLCLHLRDRRILTLPKFFPNSIATSPKDERFRKTCCPQFFSGTHPRDSSWFITCLFLCRLRSFMIMKWFRVLRPVSKLRYRCLYPFSKLISRHSHSVEHPPKIWKPRKTQTPQTPQTPQNGYWAQFFLPSKRLGYSVTFFCKEGKTRYFFCK